MSPAELLAFEARNPGWSSNKEMRIRRELELTPPRYLVLLMRAAESAEGIRADPITARRVRAPGRRRAMAEAGKRSSAHPLPATMG